MPIATINPATGETVRRFDAHDEAAIELRLARAAATAARWRDTPVGQRAAVVRRAGEILDRDRERFAALMTLEMGKTLKAAREEAAKCATACRFYAEHGASFVAPESLGSDDEWQNTLAYEPMGVVLAVMPWNFPFWQVIRFAAPALVAGNVGLLKHSSNVPQCALALEQLFRDAGAPDGAFQTLLIESRDVPRVLGDDRVAAATLTGSEPAGSSVASQAGKLIKKTVLELGGSDAFVVMPSADVAEAARVAVQARNINNGQSCIAAKRFIVHEAVYDEFARRFIDGMRALRVGDPTDEATDLGPLATASIRDDLVKQVNDSVAAGAKLLLGGHPIDGPGNYFEATVLGDASRGAPAFDEELFGPAATLFRVPSVDAAIELANATRFGLGASAWSRDAAEIARLTSGLQAGIVCVNAMVASDPRYPFGGVKRSGYGRELGAVGIREFMNLKTIRVRVGAAAAATTHAE